MLQGKPGEKKKKQHVILMNLEIFNHLFSLFKNEVQFMVLSLLT